MFESLYEFVMCVYPSMKTFFKLALIFLLIKPLKLKKKHVRTHFQNKKCVKQFELQVNKIGFGIFEKGIGLGFSCF